MQFKEWENGNPYKTFWKLHDPSNYGFVGLHEKLESHNVKYHIDSSRERLESLVIRAERGLPCYDKWTIEELRTSCDQRGLSTEAVEEDSADQPGLLTTGDEDDEELEVMKLQRRLEKADEEATFDKFDQFPAEVRLRVYDFHIRDVWRTSVKHPLCKQPPPIAAASRLVRKEVLPLFYQHPAIFLVIKPIVASEEEPPHEHAVGLYEVESWGMFGSPWVQFLRTAPTHLVKLVTKVRVFRSIQAVGGEEVTRLGTLKFEFDNTKREWIVTERPCKRKTKYESTFDKIDEGIKSLFATMGPAGITFFSSSDADAVVKVVEDVTGGKPVEKDEGAEDENEAYAYYR